MCPEGATCLGGTAKPRPKPGYWTNPSCPIGFSACEANLELGHSFICLAPNATSEFGSCREGHEGVLCHRCRDGYGRDDPTSPFCARCRGVEADGHGGLKTRLWHLLFLLGGVVFESGMSLSLIFTGLEADKRNKPEMSQLLKVLVSYLAIVKLLLSGNTVGWPTALQVFISHHTEPKGPVTSFDCWFENDFELKSVFGYALQAVPKICSVVVCTLYLYWHSYRLTRRYLEAKHRKTFMQVGAPPPFLSLSLSTTLGPSWVGHTKDPTKLTPLSPSLCLVRAPQSTDGYAKVWMTEEEEAVAFPKLLLLLSEGDRRDLTLLGSAAAFVRNLLPRVGIVCATSLWPSLLSWALGFLACGAYPRSFITPCDESTYDEVAGDKVLLWEYDKEIECFSGLHSKMLEWAALPVLCVCLFPVFVLRFLFSNSSKLYVDDKFDYTFGFLYRDYERRYFYWEFLIQVRTFALIVLVVYFSTIHRRDQDLQGLLLLVVIFFSTLLHTRYLPYVSDLVDSAQQIVLVDAAVIIIASMFFKLDMGGSGFFRYLYWPQIKETIGVLIAILHVGTLLVIGLFVAIAFLKTYAIKADSDGDNKVSREEAVEYFGKSKTAKAFIWVLWAFRLVEDVGGAEGVKTKDE